MKRRLIKNVSIICMGMICQIAFWKTDIIILGIIGYGLYLTGLAMIPETARQQKRKKNNAE